MRRRAQLFRGLRSNGRTAVALPARLYPRFETLTVGGVPIARLTRAETAKLMLDLAMDFPRRDRPWIGTSVNGQVLSEAARHQTLAEAMAFADIISCDGQPLVLASRQLAGRALPERVATTDLFHDIAAMAQDRPVTMYFLGASETENARAVANVSAAYPFLRIVGRKHGYHDHAGWIRVAREINEHAPAILWVGLGVPREQEFYMRFAHAMPRVGLIKTCGGLFNFLSASAERAPQWMQDRGLEWLHRLRQDPRRLALRYLTTNPHAAMLMLTRRRRGVVERRLGRDIE